MAKPFTREVAEDRLTNGTWGQKAEALRRLPADLDPGVPLSVVFELLGDGNNTWLFGRHCQKLTPPVIRLCLEQLAVAAPTPVRVFLREAVDATLTDSPLRSAWASALVALLDLNLTYAWGSKQRKAKLKALARQPRFVAAIQSAVVAAERPTLDMLAVLAIDASDASLDALLPHFANSENDARLEALKVHASDTPALNALLGSATHRREQKEAASTAVGFFSDLLAVDPPLTSVKFTVYLSSTQSQTGNVPLYQGSLSVSSKWGHWWAVHLTRVDRSMTMKSTRFGEGTDPEDALGVGRSSIAELPKWMATAGKKLKITWNRDALLSGSLRGKKREQVIAWLFSALT